MGRPKTETQGPQGKHSNPILKQTRESRKVRKSFTLDADVAEALGFIDGSSSAYVNRYIAEGLERDRMREAQRQYVENFEAEHGPLDPERVAYFESLLK